MHDFERQWLNRYIVDEARELIIKFTGAVMDAACIHIEAAYIQGLWDGIRFRNILLDGQDV